MKPTSLLLLFLLCQAPARLAAQCVTDISPANLDDHLRSVHFINASTGMAVGENGRAIATTDGGTTWTTLDIRTGQHLNAVTLSSTSEAWAVGDGGIIRRTTDGGATWRQAYSPTTCHLTDVQFRGGNGIIVGKCGAVLRFDPAENAWQSIRTGSTNDLRSVRFLDDDTAIAAGANGTLLRSTDAGITWSPLPSPTAADVVGFEINGNVVYLSDANGNAFRSNDGGNTWTPVAGLSSPTNGFSAHSSGRVLAVGPGGFVAKNDPAGNNSWAALTNPAIMGGLVSVSFPDPHTAFAVGENGLVVKILFLEITATGDSLACVGAPVSLAVNGPGMAASYGWAGPNFSSTLQNPVFDAALNNAGDFVATATVNGCATTDTLTLSVVPSPVATATGFNLVCDPNAPDTLVGNASPPGATYAWSGPNGFVSNEQNPVVAQIGTYTLTVTDGNGCTGTDSTTVSGDTTFTLTDIQPTPVSCFGEMNGSIQLSLVGGTPPFISNWNPPIASGLNPLNLPAGFYAVTVTDAVGCSVAGSTTVNQPTAMLLTCLQQSPVSTSGVSDGKGEFSFSGGTPPYSYSWSGGGMATNLPASTIELDNLGTGTYTITLTDDAGCNEICEFEVTIEQQTNCREQDSLVLVSLYNSTNGPNWTISTNWLVPGQPIDTWYGVQINGAGCVTCIDLDGNPNCDLGMNLGNNIMGSIPIELGNLTYLQSLFLSKNHLTGSIPAELGNLEQLQWLFLSENQLSGSIPPELGSLKQLRNLELFNNQLDGTIPIELGNLTQLQFMNLSKNLLSGPIPPELGDLTQLAGLYLFSNQLSGSIPMELENLTQLSWFVLFSNQLSGSIPTWLGDLTLLRRVSLYDNQLSGSIPLELGNLTQLQWLELSDNQLSGNIPSELSNLGQVNWIDLSNNQLNGPIPPQLGNLTTLNVLRLFNNQLSGSIPPELGNLTNLNHFYLQNNQLSGCIPDELSFVCNLGYSTQLIQNGYNLTGNPALPWSGAIQNWCNGDSQIGATCDDSNPASMGEIILLDCSCSPCPLFGTAQGIPDPSILPPTDTVITCFVDTIMLTGNASLPNVTYEWLDGSNTVISTAGTVNVSAGGTYTLVATNPALPNCPVSTQIVIGENTQAETFSLSGGMIPCPGQTTILTAVPDLPNANIQYDWGGPVSGTGPSLVTNVDGRYTVVGTTLSNGCTHTENITVTTGPAPVVGLGDDVSICDLTNTTYTIQPTPGNWQLYLWSNGSMDTAITVNTPGSYSLSVTDAQGCTATSTIHVGNSANSQITESAQLCEGSSIVVSGTTITSGGFYEITLPGNGADCDTLLSLTVAEIPLDTVLASGHICQGQTLNLYGEVFSSGGFYEITLSGNGPACDTIVQLTIEETADFAAPVLVGDTMPCAGSSAVFTITNYADALDYSWPVFPPGAVIVDNGSSATITFGGASGPLQVIATDAQGCFSHEETLSIEVMQPPAPPMPGDVFSPCISQSVGFTVLPVAGAVGYTWTLPDGSVQMTASHLSPTFSLPGAGLFEVQVTASNACGESTPLVIAAEAFDPPTASLVGGSVLCPGEATDLTINLTGDGPWFVSYTDGLGNSFSLNAASPTLSLEVSPGETAMYALTSVQDSHCTGTVSGLAEITVVVQPTPDTLRAEICMGDAYDFNGQAITAAGQYIDQVIYSATCSTEQVLDLTVVDAALVEVPDTLRFYFLAGESPVVLPVLDSIGYGGPGAPSFSVEILPPDIGRLKVQADGTIRYDDDRDISFDYAIIPDSCPDAKLEGHAVVDFRSDCFSAKNEFMPKAFIAQGTSSVGEVNERFNPCEAVAQCLFATSDCDAFSDMVLVIVNGWGEAVFDSRKSGSTVWDANEAEKFPEATYYYSFKFKYNGRTEVVKGPISIVKKE